MRVCFVRPDEVDDGGNLIKSPLMFADVDAIPDVTHFVKLENDEKTYRVHKVMHIAGTGKKHHVDLYLIRVRP